ncbi:MAG: LysR family transcriptional regulator [Spongiibacteraceae bacterium]|jgi:DNA-binding transcriptional LysR family regulator|nr:LysR family transcriptional regulator [Spongiibacteraceae bacterium]
MACSPRLLFNRFERDIDGHLITDMRRILTGIEVAALDDELGIVAELGSFTAAAHQLGVARSVVTRQIAALEEYLGVTLMLRSTRRLSLTSAGSAYLDKCQAILEMVAEAETVAMAERLTPSGRLRISLPLSFGLRCLLPLLLSFTKRYPAV